MRLLGEGPASLDGETFARDLVPRAVAGHEIADAARQRADEELHRAHAGITATVFNRLIGHQRVLAARDVKTRAAFVLDLEHHRVGSPLVPVLILLLLALPGLPWRGRIVPAEAHHAALHHATHHPSAHLPHHLFVFSFLLLALLRREQHQRLSL